MNLVKISDSVGKIK